MMPLSGEVSLDWVLDKLKLSDAPRSMALGMLEGFANASDGIQIYCNETLDGAERSGDPDLVYDSCYNAKGEEDDSPRLLIASGEPLLIKGRKRLLQFSFVYTGANLSISCTKFAQGDREYWCCDEPAMFVDPVLISADRVYCLQEEVDEIYGKLQEPNYLPSKPIGSEPGIHKALALLAREKADNQGKFRTGNKVNASAFREHIIGLAKKYDIKSSFLKSLDDKLNKALDEYDLKDICANREESD